MDLLTLRTGNSKTCYFFSKINKNYSEDRVCVQTISFGEFSNHKGMLWN